MVFVAVIVTFILIVLKQNGTFQQGLTNTLQERAMWMEGSTYQLEGTNEMEPSIIAHP
jgi:hypothetical protein